MVLALSWGPQCTGTRRGLAANGQNGNPAVSKHMAPQVHPGPELHEFMQESTWSAPHTVTA